MPQLFKLGRKKSPHDPRALRFSRYLKPNLPTPPDSADYSEKVGADWGMMANDVLGDCVLAAAGHGELGWTTNAGKPFQLTDAQIVAAYSAITGYTPNDPSTDQGTDPVSMFKYWKKHGIAGHKIGAWANVNPTKQNQFRVAISMFECVFISLAMPNYIQGNMGTWDVPGPGVSPDDAAPGSWGGHEVVGFGYGAGGVTIVTWGQRVRVTWAFLAKYCDESQVAFSVDLVSGNGTVPTGFDVAVLRADIPLVSEG